MNFTTLHVWPNSFNTTHAASQRVTLNFDCLLTRDSDWQDIELPPGHIGQEILERTLQATAVNSPEYLSAKQDMLLTAGKNGLDWVFDRYGVDALFMVREGHHSLANMVGYPIGTLMTVEGPMLL